MSSLYSIPLHQSIQIEVERKKKMKLTNGGNGGDNLSKLELVQNGGLTRSIETHHKYTHLFLGKKPAEQLGEGQPHFQLFRIHKSPSQQHRSIQFKFQPQQIKSKQKIIIIITTYTTCKINGSQTVFHP